MARTKQDFLGLHEEERPSDSDRDDRWLASTQARARQARNVASAAGSRRCTSGCATQGGARRRMAQTFLAPSPEYDYKYVAVPGRYVPLGFARYVQPQVDVQNYAIYNIAGWRAAIPRAEPGFRVKELLDRIFNYGPASAGYVRMGDMLVPAIEEPGDRMLLAQSATNSYAFPLSQ